MKKIYLTGAGMGSKELLTEKALEILLNSDAVLCGERLAGLFKPLRPDIETVDFSRIPSAAEKSKAKTISVLISGDPGFFSAAKILREKLALLGEVEIIPGVSSLQYFCGLLGISYENVKTVSFHGREGSPLGSVSYNEFTFFLTGGARKVQDICAELANGGLGDAEGWVGENLSSKSERIIKGTVRDLGGETFSDTAVLLVRNGNRVSPHGFLRDADFIRGKTPMTKEETRWIVLGALSPSPEDILYDIGAGTGSVAIELARKTSAGLVYAVEREPEALDLIKSNVKKLGAFNVVPIEGEAPRCLEFLPPPHKAFIGGSGGNLQRVVNAVLGKNPKAKIVVNALTLETLAEALNVFKERGLKTAVTCLNAARGSKAGKYVMMKANNPVYIISAED